MYEYKYVKIVFKGVLKYRPAEDYKSIINKNANDEWRLVQIFAP